MAPQGNGCLTVFCSSSLKTNFSIWYIWSSTEIFLSIAGNSMLYFFFHKKTKSCRIQEESAEYRRNLLAYFLSQPLQDLSKTSRALSQHLRRLSQPATPWTTRSILWEAWAWSLKRLGRATERLFQPMRLPNQSPRSLWWPPRGLKQAQRGNSPPLTCIWEAWASLWEA